ncbi:MULTISPECIES: hypothetical protein [Vibrionaceae]|uniref:Uncharacterized protein n=1 Tax=Photobacterium jeanii TaxID=858640 RepID=A0A178KA55_9GAMM|nr:MULTISPECIES: hypothetical protein [Vibrionaceae]OAN14229.1 hypothetical protein A3K86_11660 [Photobacterium jeanii]OQK29555.1 hypothetical protein XM69_c10622 [Vibrio parahaemolyticus]PST89750.1 hypothetical protein C9I91_12275 [Photobacterium jeanii]TON24940.1 hypothetical protein CGH60_19145 [Vibrio parahaemolyticus]
MGSTGSGKFTDYTGNRDEGAQTGGSSQQDQCELAFSCILEEVAQSAYYSTHGKVPQVGAQVIIQFEAPRIVAVDISTNLSCGALPTKYNYLLKCLNDNYNYFGIVTNSNDGPHPLVEIDVSPSKS